MVRYESSNAPPIVFFVLVCFATMGMAFAMMSEVARQDEFIRCKRIQAINNPNLIRTEAGENWLYIESSKVSVKLSNQDVKALADKVIKP